MKKSISFNELKSLVLEGVDYSDVDDKNLRDWTKFFTSVPSDEFLKFVAKHCSYSNAAQKEIDYASNYGPVSDCYWGDMEELASMFGVDARTIADYIIANSHSKFEEDYEFDERYPTAVATAVVDGFRKNEDVGVVLVDVFPESDSENVSLDINAVLKFYTDHYQNVKDVFTEKHNTYDRHFLVVCGGRK